MKTSQTYTFDTWLDELGIEGVAKLLKVSKMTVRYWKGRLYYPRVEQIKRIRKLTQGLITYEMIIDRGIRRTNRGSR